MDGLQVKKNSRGHMVIRLHYSADPDKNPSTPEGRKWLETASSKYMGGVNDLKWRQEMEIDFKAGSGELVFPNFVTDQDRFVIDPFRLDDTFVYYAGLDWGTRNPVSFHVYAESVDKRLFSVWEYYAERRPVVEVCRAIRECPYYEKLQWIAADPTIWSETVAKKDGFTSIAEMMQDTDEVGDFTIDKLMPAHGRSDESCINRVKNLWTATPAKLQIFKTCPYQIEELRSLKYPQRKDTVNEAEKILDKNNHAWDDMKYFLLSHPYAATQNRQIPFNTLEYYNEVAETAARISEKTGQDYQTVFYSLYGESF